MCKDTISSFEFFQTYVLINLDDAEVLRTKIDNIVEELTERK